MHNPSEQEEIDREKIAPGLRKLRRRRGFLLALIAGYIPVIWVTLEVTQSDRKTGMVFLVWILLVAVAACLTALGACPRCRNPFHMNGIIPIYFLKKCLHCGLPLKADKEG